MHHLRTYLTAGQGDILSSQAVNAISELRVPGAAFDIGISGTVDNHIGAKTANRGLDVLFVGDVHLRQVCGVQHVRREPLLKRASQLSIGTCNEYAHPVSLPGVLHKLTPPAHYSLPEGNC